VQDDNTDSLTFPRRKVAVSVFTVARKSKDITGVKGIVLAFYGNSNPSLYAGKIFSCPWGMGDTHNEGGWLEVQALKLKARNRIRQEGHNLSLPPCPWLTLQVGFPNQQTAWPRRAEKFFNRDA
jgi:hypothetical protein